MILGGGPAGAAAAIVLARAGLRPVVLERHAGPHDALCGGFLSWSTTRRLRELGVDPAALGARPVGRVRLLAGERSAAARLPRICWSLSRAVLDEALLGCATGAGAGVERGVKVVGLNDDGVQLAGGVALTARARVLATGKHDLRGDGRVQDRSDRALGLRWRLPGTERLRGLVADAVELHLFAAGYAGLAIQQDGTGNLCMAVRRSLLDRAGGDPARLLVHLADRNPALARRIAAAGDDPGQVQAVANVPYGWIAGHPAHGAMRVGDQAAVIASLAGEGIAIAVASGAAAGEAVAAGLGAVRFQKRLARRARLPVRIAGGIAGIAAQPWSAAVLVGAVGLMPVLSSLAARASRFRDRPGRSGYSMPPG